MNLLTKTVFNQRPFFSSAKQLQFLTTSKISKISKNLVINKIFIKTKGNQAFSIDLFGMGKGYW